jgi:hypothetical protein
MKYLLAFLLLWYSVFANAEASYTATDGQGTSIIITDKPCTVLPLKGWAYAEVKTPTDLHIACAAWYAGNVLIVNQHGGFIVVPVTLFKEDIKA